MLPLAAAFSAKRDSGRAVSRILSAPPFPKLLATGGGPSPAVALEKAGERIICLSSQYPGPVSEIGAWSGPPRGPLFGLAPDGVFRASRLAPGAVGSYSTFSPLPRSERARRFVFCGTIRQAASRPTFPRISNMESPYEDSRKVTRHRALRCSDFPPSR